MRRKKKVVRFVVVCLCAMAYDIIWLPYSPTLKAAIYAAEIWKCHFQYSIALSHIYHIKSVHSSGSIVFIHLQTRPSSQRYEIIFIFLKLLLQKYKIQQFITYFLFYRPKYLCAHANRPIPLAALQSSANTG